MTQHIEAIFPQLANGGYRVTSPQTQTYNCVAWAVGDTRRWWWPAPGYYWPAGVNQGTRVGEMLQPFEQMGYEECQNADLESGYEKVALYAKVGVCTHAARQLEDGSWTSKLGGLEDISHDTLQELEGNAYGMPVTLLRRRRT